MNGIGLGVDAHAFAPGRELVLGGVRIPGHDGLSGHSDGDALSHAVADALLGAARLGDIGDHFPAEDRWKDASSLDILADVAALVAGAGWSVSSVDATVVAQAPPLARHRDAMRSQIARALRIGVERVSVKATTTDALGFTGRGEGIAAIAVALIERPDAGK